MEGMESGTESARPDMGNRIWNTGNDSMKAVKRRRVESFHAVFLIFMIDSKIPIDISGKCGIV